MGAKFWLSALAIIALITWGLSALHKVVTAQPKPICTATCRMDRQWRTLQARGVGFDWHGHPPCVLHGGIQNVTALSPATRWLYATYIVTCNDGSVLNDVPATDNMAVAPSS